MTRQNRYILAIDQSTSATKVMLFDAETRLTNRVSILHRQYYPQPGFVEHEPLEIYYNTLNGISRLLSAKEVSEKDIVSISITNQRETVIIWDRHSGKPVANAAVWQCKRGVDICNQLQHDGYGELIRSKTGLIIDPYFSASKLQWMMDHVEGLKSKAKNGDLLLGTMDTWLIWKLTEGKVHATDYSNACRTLLFNIHTLEWDEDLIRLFGLHPSMFPKVRYSDEIVGNTRELPGITSQLPISGVIGDSHGALFGQHCFSKGMTKATYGTGSSIMMNIGKKPKDAPEGLVTSIGFSCNQSVDYVFEGNIHCTGDTINWLVNSLQLIQSPQEAENIALSVDHNGGVYLVPAFVGLGAPHWDHEARACICGMGRDATKAHVVRAALESIAYQIKDLTELMSSGSGVELNELRVDGGPTRNKFLMQFQADILDKTVVPSEIEEISALGSVYLAGMATGLWPNIHEIDRLRKTSTAYTGSMSRQEIASLYQGWQRAVKRTRYKPEMIDLCK